MELCSDVRQRHGVTFSEHPFWLSDVSLGSFGKYYELATYLADKGYECISSASDLSQGYLIKYLVVINPYLNNG